MPIILVKITTFGSLPKFRIDQEFNGDKLQTLILQIPGYNKSESWHTVSIMVGNEELSKKALLSIIKSGETRLVVIGGMNSESTRRVGKFLNLHWQDEVLFKDPPRDRNFTMLLTLGENGEPIDDTILRY